MPKNSGHDKKNTICQKWIHNNTPPRQKSTKISRENRKVAIDDLLQEKKRFPITCINVCYVIDLVGRIAN